MKALALVVVAGCAATPLDQIGIACTQDSDCPPETWCDLGFYDHVCRELAVSQPPKIVFDGLLVDDQIVSTITVPTHSVSFHEFRVHDEGSEAYVVFVITAPNCVDASTSTRSDGELVRAGATFDGTFTTFPDPGCGSPATLAFEATADGRVSTFSTTIQIAP